MLSFPGSPLALSLPFKHFIANLMLNIRCGASLLCCIAHTVCIFSKLQFPVIWALHIDY